MISARKLLPLCLVAGLAGCVSEPVRPGAVMVVPGPGKDLAAFQQDDTICRQHAAAQTGFGPPVQASARNGTPAGGTGPAASRRAGATPAAGNGINGPPAVMPPNEVAYMQCMAARGDRVEPEPDADAAAYPGGLYPYWYGYPYAYDGFYGGLGFGWARSYGGWRGGVRSRPGFAHAGFAHAGAGHGGVSHGGAGHGSGGHR